MKAHHSIEHAQEGDYHTIHYHGAVIPFSITLAPYGRLYRDNKDVVLQTMRDALADLVAESNVAMASVEKDIEKVLEDLGNRIDKIVNDRGSYAKWINSLHIPEKRVNSEEHVRA